MPLVPTPTVGYPSLQLDFDIHTSGQIQACQRLYCSRGWLDDVDEPLVRAHLELLARVFVDERRAQYGVLLDPGWQRHRTRDTRASVLRRLHDLRRGLVQNPM